MRLTYWINHFFSRKVATEAASPTTMAPALFFLAIRNIPPAVKAAAADITNFKTIEDSFSSSLFNCSCYLSLIYNYSICLLFYLIFYRLSF